MRLRRCVLSGVVVAFLVACDDGPQPTGPPGVQLSHSHEVTATATGGGNFLVTIGEGFPAEFAFSGVQQGADGTATGNFRFSIVFFGELVEFHGRTTCMTVDAENGRAWFGGVITKNNSTHPAWLTEAHEPGDAIWFRAVDYGEGAGSPSDRTTFVGFEGNAGIITSREYCDLQIWPEGDERTWEVVDGNVEVRP